MADIDQLCDRVAFIVNGEIKEIDSPRNLKLRYGKKSLKVEYRNNGDLKSMEFEMNNIGKNSDFLDLIKNNQIETIHSGETTLEDIFIKVTGVELGDNNE
jgi:fluoroquinolone transport system ATP-binding protein